jgi:hypothetical protein
VQKADEQRDVQGEKVAGGQMGRPADGTLFAKISIARKNAYTFGLMPIVTLPTGKPELLIGDGSPNYGALFLLSGTVGRVSWAANSGYLQHSKPLVLNDDRANPVVVRGQFLNYAGTEYRLSSLLSFGANVQVKVSAGDKFDFTRSNPAEWAASGKLRPLPSLELQAGLGTGIGQGIGSPDYRVFVGATFVPDQTPPSRVPAHHTVATRR